MYLGLKTVATQSYSTARIVACADQLQFMLKVCKRFEICTASYSIAATTTFASTAALKQFKWLERDNTTALVNQGHTTKTYQSYSTTATDRPVYSLASYFGEDLVNGKHLTRHSRFYSTKPSTKKKMASIFRRIKTYFLCFQIRGKLMKIQYFAMWVEGNSCLWILLIFFIPDVCVCVLPLTTVASWNQLTHTSRVANMRKVKSLRRLGQKSASTRDLAKKT